MPNEIHLISTHLDEYVNSLEQSYLDERNYDTLISGEDVDVFKPDGTALLIFRHQVLPSGICRVAYPSLLKAANPSDNRGAAAGGKRFHDVNIDGTLSKVSRSPTVLSGTIGFYDREPRAPYCRTTRFTSNQVEHWDNVLPFIRAVNDVYQQACPERYAAQLAVVERTAPAYVISGTVFTTVTVNRNWRTAVHKDSRDLPEGFGVMSVIHAGQYEGGYLCFPKYRVAVDMRSCDVLLADVHEWHGNTEIVGEVGNYERISTVMYYRERMIHCLNPSEELQRAKRRKPGTPLF